MVNASVEECAAHEFYLNSRGFRRTAKNRGITEYPFKKLNDHTFYYTNTRDLGFFLNLRDWRNEVTRIKEESGKVIMVVSDTKDLMEEYPVKDRNVLASIQSVLIFEPINPIGDIPQRAMSFPTRLTLEVVFQQ